MATNNFFDSFKSKAPMYVNLGAGKNQSVRISRVVITDSRHEFNGDEKTDLPEYDDATPQIAVVFVSTEGKGTIVNRYNGSGYVRFSELTPKQIKSGKYQDVDDYACITDKDDNIVRIEDPERCESCVSILSQLFHALELPEGSGMDELNESIEDGTPLLIDVTEESYEGKPQMRVSKAKRAGLVTAKTEAETSLDKGNDLF